MKTILITGGAGYVGSHAAKAFAESGYKVVVLDNLVYGYREFAKWGDFYEGDIGNKTLLNEIFSKHKIDVISHFAAYALVGESVTNPAKYYINNVSKANDMLLEAINNGVKAFQFSSTCATYGVPQKLPITEDHPRLPINPYGRTKMIFEDILEDYSKAMGISYSIMRYFNAAGASPEAEIGEAHNPETHLIPIILDAAMGRRPAIEIYGDDYDTPDGTCIRDYIHVTDLAAAHVLAIDKMLKTNTSSLYNLGNGKGFSVKEVINTTEKVVGKEIPVKMGKRRPGDPPALVGSSSKIQKELAWNPKYADIEVIVETAWKWYQDRFKNE